MTVNIRCGICRDKFQWDIENGYPTHCLICDEFIGIPADAPEVSAPYISQHHRVGAADRVYRDMERKSEVRAQMAAEDSGLSAAEVSHLKLTNMKDNLREGDTAFSDNLGSNPVHQAMQAAPQNTGFSDSRTAGLQASATVRSTVPVADRGTSFIQNNLKQNHSRRYNAPVSDMHGKDTRR